METEFITQPADQLGRILLHHFDREPRPVRVILVSAFVALQTTIRLRDAIATLRAAGVPVRVVVGVDMGGTSREVLQEIGRWDVDRRIVKHRHPGHTFHPKIYLVEWADRAEIILGSSNLTEGGMFNNYEASSRIRYALPNDQPAYAAAQQQLQRFIDPQGPTAYQITPELLAQILQLPEIPNEAEARRRRAANAPARLQEGAERPANPFGVEDMQAPPPLPAALLDQLIVNVQRRRREARAVPEHQPAAAAEPQQAPQIAPAAFYMTLPTLQGPNIPGEARIPLDAIELAQDFWGWPDNYERKESPRAGNRRVYWDWKPNWRIRSVAEMARANVLAVRMYMYDNSSDFRFYARPLVNAGGDLGDIVRITRVAEPGVEFDCVLARRGTREHALWLPYCTQAVRNSDRRFGYA